MLPVERGVPILNAKVSSDPFLETLERVAMEATRKLFELRVKDPTSNWREHQMVAEIYHGLRDCGVNFDDLNLEAPRKGTRRHFDLYYAPRSMAIQVVPYKTPLHTKFLNDLDAFNDLDPKMQKVLILARVGGAKVGFRPDISGKLGKARSQGIHIIECEP